VIGQNFEALIVNAPVDALSGVIEKDAGLPFTVNQTRLSSRVFLAKSRIDKPKNICNNIVV